MIINVLVPVPSAEINVAVTETPVTIQVEVRTASDISTDVSLAAIAAAFGLDSISINSDFQLVAVKSGVTGTLTFQA